MAILIAGVVVVLYCVTGGMWSLTLTDIIQFGIMTFGILGLLLPFAVSEAGGFGGMADALPSSYFDPTSIGWDTIFTYFLLFFFGLMIGQDIWQRIFTGRDQKVMRTGTIVAGLYCMVYGIAGALIGAAAKVILPNRSNPGEAFAQVVEAVLPTGLVGLVLAAALAAIMSTASAALLASSAILANDLLALVRPVRSALVATRVTTFLVGAAVVGVSIALNDVVGALAVASMAVSSVVVAVVLFASGLSSNDPIIYGLLSSVAVYVGVTLAGAPTRATTGAQVTA